MATANITTDEKWPEGGEDVEVLDSESVKEQGRKSRGPPTRSSSDAPQPPLKKPLNQNEAALEQNGLFRRPALRNTDKQEVQQEEQDQQQHQQQQQ